MRYFDLFNGAIRVNGFVFLLNTLLLLHFIINYFWSSYRKGFKVDFWHAKAFLIFVVPILIMYPTAASYWHEWRMGHAVFSVQPYVNQAYLINAVGYIAAYAGYYFYNVTRHRTLAYFIVDRVNRPFARLTYFALLNRTGMHFLFGLGIFFSTVFLAIAVPRYGLNFQLRDYSLADPTIKPLLNFTLASYVPIVLMLFGIRYYQFREKVIALYFCVFAFVLFFSGSRSGFLLPLLNLIVFYAIVKRRRISLTAILLLGFTFLMTAFYLGALRNGENTSFGSLINNFSLNLFYGNNFSDITDFAWVLTGWDGRFLNGMTYVAGLLSFIPRSLSELRETYTFGVFTARAVGFNPTMHAGFHIGPYGEIFLNFNWIGVVVLGFSSGYVLRYVDASIKEQINGHEPHLILKIYSLSIIFVFVNSFYNTNGFWANYILIFVLLSAYGVRQIVRNINRAQSRYLSPISTAHH